jgi:hypothetical protein
MAAKKKSRKSPAKKTARRSKEPLRITVPRDLIALRDAVAALDAKVVRLSETLAQLIVTSLVTILADEEAAKEAATPATANGVDHAEPAPAPVPTLDAAPAAPAQA